MFPEFAAVLKQAVNAGSATHAVLIPDNTQCLNPFTERVDPCFINAGASIGTQQLADACQLRRSHPLGLGESPIIRHRALPLRLLLRDDRTAAVGQRVVLDEVQKDGPLGRLAGAAMRMLSTFAVGLPLGKPL